MCVQTEVLLEYENSGQIRQLRLICHLKLRGKWGGGLDLKGIQAIQQIGEKEKTLPNKFLLGCLETVEHRRVPKKPTLLGSSLSATFSSYYAKGITPFLECQYFYLNPLSWLGAGKRLIFSLLFLKNYQLKIVYSPQMCDRIVLPLTSMEIHYFLAVHNMFKINVYWVYLADIFILLIAVMISHINQNESNYRH